MEVLVVFTSLQNIVILSIVVIVPAGVKSTNVVCPDNYITAHMTFVSLQYFRKQVLWT